MTTSVKIASRKFTKATIKDVAESARVSVTTVSHFLNERKFACSAETAERIKEAIRTLHYAPGPSARRVRDQATHTVGLCIDSADDISETFDPRRTYHERLNRAIVREADEASYALLHYPRSIRHGTTAEAFLDGRVDGLIFGSGPSDRRVHDLVDAGLPTVIVNRLADAPDAAGVVSISERDAINLAMSHLWELGHRKIAHLAGPTAEIVDGLVMFSRIANSSQDSSSGLIDGFPSDSANRRCEAYIGFMRERSVFSPSLLISAGSWADSKEVAVDAVLSHWLELSSPPTAVVCVNDSLAIALNAACRRQGVRVPDDLSIIGIGNRASTEEAQPALSSVDIPVEELGRESMRLLLRMMDGDELDREQLRIELPVTRLIVRKSTAAVGA
jgi:DNA-binding LacI/PurR family transcriptional regulator